MFDYLRVSRRWLGTLSLGVSATILATAVDITFTHVDHYILDGFYGYVKYANNFTYLNSLLIDWLNTVYLFTNL